MHELIFFLIGCLLGGIIGVATMCLLQINRLKNTDSTKRVTMNEKKKY